jgi:predicted nuclease of predicted toxin-antitoxin system
VKFKIDENLPAELAEDLERLGHSADTIADEGLVGAVDSVVVAAAKVEGRIVLTLDKGIADIVASRPKLTQVLSFSGRGLLAGGPFSGIFGSG